MIVLGRNELMSSRMRGSEEALAVMTLEPLTAPVPHLLIGGYGMGFTLRAFRPVDDHYGLGCLGAASGAVTIHNAVTRWNKTLLMRRGLRAHSSMKLGTARR